ncbi:MAG: hypothetical protein ACUZ77_02710 [Candidatus Brocadiales bacterium]
MKDQTSRISCLLSTVYCILFPKFLVPCLLFAVYCILFPIAQPTHAQWAATYGGGGFDVANSIQQTRDGGYIVAGGTSSFGAGFGVDFWVLKLDANGIVQWQKTYGGGGFDVASSIQQTSDGGYIVAGGTGSFGAGRFSDIWVLKLDANGIVQWQKTYGGDFNEASSIQQTSDGGYVGAGWTSSFGAGMGDIWVLKLDANGIVQWQKTYGGSDSEGANSIQQTRDGGYIVAGWTESFGAGFGAFWVLKLDSGGNIQWQKTYGERGSDSAHSIQQTSDGGYIVVGGNPFRLVLKLDSFDNIQWQKTYGGVNFFDEANSIQQTSDDGYVVAGEAESFGAGFEDFWVLKLDSFGNVQWQKTYEGGFANSSIQQTSDGGYIVAGERASLGGGSSDFWVLKLRQDGTIDPSCNFIVDTSVSGIDSDATVTDTNATVADTTVIPRNTSATDQDTNVSANILCSAPIEICDDGIDNDGDGLVDCEDPDCVNDPACCDSTEYSRGLSFIRFREGQKDKVSMRMCVNQTFCDVLKVDPEEMILRLDECNQITIPGSRLKPTKFGFSAKSVSGESPKYVLKINCEKYRLKLRLKKLDIKDCISNPVKVCVFIKDGPCLCTKKPFEEKRKKGKLKKLFLRVKQTCPPF